MRALGAATLVLLSGCEMILSFDRDLLPDARSDAALVTPDAAVCGNGFLEGDEECDDGSGALTGGCPMCRVATCGDSLVRAGIEECDPGESTGAACNTSCLSCTAGAAQLHRAANQHCYLRFAAESIFNDARADCFARGGHLVSFGDAAENTEVVTALAPAAQVWMGLDDRDVEGTFVWTTQERLTYTNWSTGNPNNGGGVGAENCGTVTTNGTWNDAACASTFGYVCEQSPWVQRPEDGHIYRMVPGLFSWDEAQAACVALGGALATITSLEEQNFLATRINGRPWIGASDTATEGTFAWVTGEPWGFTAWSTGEPNDGLMMEDCAIFLADLSAWNDAACATPLSALCEVAPAP